MGLIMKEKQAVTREYKPRYKKASKKEKRRSWTNSSGLPDTIENLLFGCYV